MKPKVKIVAEPDVQIPSYATPGSAGIDLRASIPHKITLRSLERALIPTGIKIALPVGYEAQIRPRSGLALKHGITCLNTPGTIDSDYRGQIKVAVHNDRDSMKKIEPHERIAQFALLPKFNLTFEEVSELDETARGEGGFGSSGSK